MHVPTTTTGHESLSADAAALDAIDVQQCVERACARIAPTWPLDRFIAVNPLWGSVDRKVADVAADLAALSGARMRMPRAWFLEQWRAGHLSREDLEDAIVHSGLASELTVETLIERMHTKEPARTRRTLLVDVVEKRTPRDASGSWRDFVLHRISQLCAAYFDDGQAQLRATRAGGLYATWLRMVETDGSGGWGVERRLYDRTVASLPVHARDLLSMALRELEVPRADRTSYLTALLLDINGWASWCSYLRWTAGLASQPDEHMVELLAIRLAYEWMLHQWGGATVHDAWRHAMARWHHTHPVAVSSADQDWVMQRALEVAWQRELCGKLSATSNARRVASPSVQVAFCIDVRSEVFRRALESVDESVQTVGFAGFFGMPIEYLPLGADIARPQLPGLLAPKYRVVDLAASETVDARRRLRLGLARAWKRFRSTPLSAFMFVETLGAAFAVRLLADTFGTWSRDAERADRAGLTSADHASRRPRLTFEASGEELTLAARAKLAEQMLRAMSLTRDFAPLVLLIGHGSVTRNNPHAAGLDCGACCGQAGDVNARVAAALLNQPEVRSALVERGIPIPTDTWFVAGLHNTTTDEVTLFETEQVPTALNDELLRTQKLLDIVGAKTRRERAAKLGLDALSDSALHAAMVQRTRDWAQVRPEWGLANNAAFIAAPRERSRGIDLQGRVFLHDYRFEQDTELSVLELIMTAPMVVAHWINFQYYASTVDNLRYGSGNKVLHNVVNGHIGVFEGNGGDLRIGLPMQCLHDGQSFVHTPLRLSVFIEAPQQAIESILAKHATVRALVDNHWLFLFQIEPGRSLIRIRRDNAWHSVEAWT